MHDVPSEIRGASDVAAKLGGWPSFHDAEVVSLTLSRGSSSAVLISLPDASDPKLCTRVTFTLTDVDGLSLCEFNAQNVIQNLYVERDGDGLLLHLVPCYGLNGWIHAKEIKVAIPSDASAQSNGDVVLDS